MGVRKPLLLVLAVLLAGGNMMAGAGGRAVDAAGPGSPAAGGERAMVLVYGGYISHVAAGGPWKTVLTVANIHEEKQAEYELRFWSAAGDPMTVTLADGVELRTGSVFAVNLPPLATVRLETVSEASEVRVGWATMERKEGTTGYCNVFATFRAVVPGRPDYEALVVSEGIVSRAVVPFDNSNGFGTAVAVVNPYRTDPLELDIEIYGSDGQLVAKYRERLERGGHAAFQTAEKWPATAGRDGIIRIRRATGSVTTVPVASDR
jgi:hypothetical protein